MKNSYLSKSIVSFLIIMAIGFNAFLPSVYASSKLTAIDNNNTKEPTLATKSELLNAFGTLQYRIYYDNLGGFVSNIEELSVNGEVCISNDTQEDYSVHYYGLKIDPAKITRDENEILIKSKGYKPILLKIKKTGELISQKTLENKNQNEKINESSEKTQINKEEINKNNEKPQVNKEESKGKNLTINDSLEDGIYTVSFKAYQIKKPNETSMLQGAFDKKVKLSIKNGKYKLTFLNNALSCFLYDFTIENNKQYTKPKVTPYGEFDKNGNPEMKIYEMEISDLTPHIAGVLVGPMGGQVSDIGKINKYTKLKIVFENEVKRGFNGFLDEKNKASEGEALNKALIENHLDKNKDGVVSDSEIKNASGTIDLSSCEIRDIKRLQSLGDKVEKLYLNGNLIKELPKGVFDNLRNLKVLCLTSNRLTYIENGIFDKLEKLERLEISNNILRAIPYGALDKLKNLKLLGLTDNEIVEFDDNIFSNLENLKGLYLRGNKINKLPKSISILRKLESIDLSKNQLEKLPIEFKDLISLKSLDLSNNKINNIPNDTFENMKSLERVILNDNNIKSLPINIIEDHAKLSLLEVKFNKIRSFPRGAEEFIENEKMFFYPQKENIDVEIDSKNKEIKWNDNLSVLDLFTWNIISGFRKTNNINVDLYKSQLNGEKTEDYIDKRGFDWTIKTEVQKKNQNGKYESIMVKTIDDKGDETSSKYKDENMKLNDEYKVVKSLYTTRSTDKEISISNIGKAKVFKMESNINHETNILNEENKNIENNINQSPNNTIENNINENSNNELKNTVNILNNNEGKISESEIQLDSFRGLDKGSLKKTSLINKDNVLNKSNMLEKINTSTQNNLVKNPTILNSNLEYENKANKKDGGEYALTDEEIGEIEEITEDKGEETSKDLKGDGRKYIFKEENKQNLDMKIILGGILTVIFAGAVITFGKIKGRGQKND